MKEIGLFRLYAESQAAFSSSEQRVNSYLLMQMITNGTETQYANTNLSYMYVYTVQ